MKSNIADPGSTRRDVVIQDSTSPFFQYFIINELKDDITLTSDIAVDDEVINVSSGHGFTGAAGEMIVIWEDNKYIQYPVISVATDAITISTPIDQVFTVAGAQVIRGSNLMNVDGSSSDVIFKMQLRDTTVPIDISAIVVTMQHGANVPDDGKFGGIAALTKGLWFRKDDDFKFNLGNYTMNQDFKDVGGVVTYTDKAPAGTNATNVVFDLKQVFGQVMRINERFGDVFLGTVRDPIAPANGMAKMTVSLIGSYTLGE